MSEDPIETFQEAYLKTKRIAIDDAKAKGQDWGEDIVGGAPYVKINLSLGAMAAKSSEELDTYFKDQIVKQLKKDGPGPYLSLLLNNFEKNIAFRGFSKKLEDVKSGWSSYEAALKNIRKYGFDKPTMSPTPIYPSWVGPLSAALGFAGLHSEENDKNNVSFILAYKGESSIIFDPWDYKEYGVRFDQEKVKSNPDLQTWKGRLVGVIEIRYT
jgi:hypothetical protein